MNHFLITGILLGLSAGLSPGPLLTLVISETLRHGIRSGMKVALAPMITDLPIILLTLFVLARLADFHPVLGLLSLAGGFFILFMGFESLRAKGVELDIQAEQPKSLTKGVLANALNPHPYLFWLSVGAPTMIRAMDISPMAPVAFLFGFYVFLVGSKVLLAIGVGKSKLFLNGRIYVYVMRFLGLALCVLAFVLFRNGLTLLGLLK
jgi:threonine/homoserine/homoserine lactone efflux protein